MAERKVQEEGATLPRLLQPHIDAITSAFPTYVVPNETYNPLVPIKFDVKSPNASLRFDLEVLLYNFYQNASIKIEEALIGSVDVSKLAQRQWLFFSTLRHPSLVQTLQIFFDWWTNVDVSNLPNSSQSGTAFDEVGLPDDVLNVLLGYTQDLVKMRLALASKAWSRVLDNEDDWCRRWMQDKHILNQASLALCGSFRARFALIYLSQQHMTQSRGLMHDIVRDVSSQTSSSWDSITVESEAAHAASDAVGYTVVKSSYQGSYSTTSYIRLDLMDISRWPRTSRRSVNLVGQSRYTWVGRDFIADTRHASVGSISKTLASQPSGPNNQAKVEMTKLNYKVFSSDRFKQNLNPAYPWILQVEHHRSTDQCSIRAYDTLAQTFVSDKITLVPGDGRSTYWMEVVFVGQHLFTGQHDFWTYYYLDLDTGKFSAPRALRFLNSFSNEADRSIPTLFADSQRFYLCKSGDDGGSHLYNAPFDVLRLTDVEIEQALLSSLFSFNISVQITQVHPANRLVFVGSAYRFAIIDLRLQNPRILCAFQTRTIISLVRWIDESLLCIDQRDKIFLLDFVGRSKDENLNSRTPPLLPFVRQNMAVLEVDPTTGSKSISYVTIPPQTLRFALQYYFGDGQEDQDYWTKTTSMSTQSNGKDTAIRPATYIWFRSKNSSRTKESLKFVDSWDTCTARGSFEWLSESDIDQPLPPRDTFRPRKQGRSEAPRPTAADLRLPQPKGRVEAVALMCNSDFEETGRLFYSMTDREAQAAFERLPQQEESPEEHWANFN